MLNLIVAPNCYAPKAEKIAKTLVKILKAEKKEYSVYFSKSFEDLEKNVAELFSFGEFDYVVVGDDVVISKVLNAVKDEKRIRLGIIPIGKQDDFANYIGVNQSPVQALKDILKNETQSVDYMVLNGRVVLDSIIIGASVEAWEAYQSYGLKNIISEKVALNKFAKKFSGIELFVDTKNGKSKKENVFEMIIANGGLSKGKSISPLSNTQDGVFNLIYSTVETDEDKKRFLRLFETGSHIYDTGNTQLWINNLRIANTDKKIKALVDGSISVFEELNITIVEKGLKVYK